MYSEGCIKENIDVDLFCSNFFYFAQTALNISSLSACYASLNDAIKDELSILSFNFIMNPIFESQASSPPACTSSRERYEGFYKQALI